MRGLLSGAICFTIPSSGRNLFSSRVVWIANLKENTSSTPQALHGGENVMYRCGSPLRVADADSGDLTGKESPPQRAEATVGYAQSRREGPRVGPREPPRELILPALSSFKDSPRNVPRRCPRKCPRKVCSQVWSGFTCPVFTCSVPRPIKARIQVKLQMQIWTDYFGNSCVCVFKKCERETPPLAEFEPRCSRQF